MAERCGNCRYWQFAEHQVNPTHAQCHRYPPVLVTRHRPLRGDTPGRAAWPDTAREHWCGEWEPVDLKVVRIA